MSLNTVYHITFPLSYINSRQADFNEFVRLTTLSAQNLIDGKDWSTQDQEANKILILLEALDYTGITSKESEAINYCLESFYNSAPAISGFSFSSTFITAQTVSFTEYLKLCTNTAKKIVAGKQPGPAESRSIRMLTILRALDSDGLTAKEIEALEYCLLQLNFSLTTRTLSALVDVSAPAEEAQNYSLNAYGGYFNLTGQDATFSQAYQITAESGSFSLTGQDATLELALDYDFAAGQGSFVLTGQDASFTYTPPADPYLLEMELAEAIAGLPTWRAVFDMESSPYTQDILETTGNGDTDTGSLTETGNIVCTVYKITNSGIAEDAGTVDFLLNGGSQDTQNFIASDNLDGSGTNYKQYIFTGLSPGDILKASVIEG